MIRPWCRSRLFWLGLPGLLFLLWGWWDSGTWYTQAHWLRGTGTYQAHVAAGKLSLVVYTEIHSRERVGTDLFWWKRSPDHVPGSAGTKLMFPQWDVPGGFECSRRILQPATAGSFTYRVTTVRMSGWLITGCYLAVWLAAVVGWQRWKARIMRRAAAGEA